MGSDIHFAVEYKTHLKDPVWHYVRTVVLPCTACDGTGNNDHARYCKNCGSAIPPNDYQWNDVTGERKLIQENIGPHDPVTKKCLFGATLLELSHKPCWRCNGKKRHMQEYYAGRNYELFAILSGVRGLPEVGFTLKHRGVPQDASDAAQRYFDCTDYHSHTWYTLRELRRRKWHDHPRFERTLQRLEALGKKKNGGDPDLLRVILAYDN